MSSQGNARKVIVPDTSVLINRTLSRMIESGELQDAEVVIPIPALDELQAQASRGRTEGKVGLEEIKRIRELGAGRNVTVRFSGERPTLEEILSLIHISEPSTSRDRRNPSGSRSRRC